MSKGSKLFGLAALGAAAGAAAYYLKNNKKASQRLEEEFDDFIDDCEEGIAKCKSKIPPQAKKYADVAAETAEDLSLIHI